MGSNIYVAPFYYPPTVATPYPGGIQPGQIVLYKDESWTSQSLTIDTNSPQYPEGYPFSFVGTPLNDAATWIAFWLPVGTVCTLFQNVLGNPSPDNPYNFAGAGICVDLIGNGQIQTVNLIAYGANDMLSAGIWREVDVSEGWFQLFLDSNYSGPFNTLFADEWPTGKPNSLAGWAINGNASSVNYPCLTPPQVLVLTANSDGTGQQVSFGAANPFGTWATVAQANLGDSGMNDKVQAFALNLYQPQKVLIQSVTSNYTIPIGPGQTIEETVSGTNTTSATITIDTQIAETQSYTVSNETTLAYSMSATVSTTVTVTEGVPDVSQASGSITTSFTAETSESTSRSYSSSQTFSLGQEITFTVPAQSKYKATASVSFGTLPSIQVQTTGQFYYQPKLPGALQDPATGLWVLDNPVVVTLGGAVGTQVTFYSEAEPIVTGRARLARA